MTDRSKKTPATVSMLLHLVSIGLVGAATIILFGIASVSLLGTGKEPFRASSIGEGVFRHSDGNAAPITVPTYTSTRDSANILPAYLPQATSPTEMPDARGAEPDFEQPMPERDASTTTSEARNAALIPDPPIGKTQSTEVSLSEQAATERPPFPGGARGTPDAYSRTVSSEIPDEGRDQVSRNAEIPQNQPAKLSQFNVASDEKAPAQKVQNQRVHEHLLSSDPAFRHRVQKECGPISFPALRRHCVASFGIHYR